MPSQDFQPRVVNGHFLVRDPHREHLSDIVPRHRVAVLPIGDEPLHVHGPIHDLRHLVRPLGQGNQVRDFFRVHVEGPPSCLPVNTHVSHFRQPPGGHLVEMLQGAELAAAQEVRFDEVERPLHLAFRLGPPGPTGHRPEAVMRGEGQEAGVVDRLVAFVTPPQPSYYRRDRWRPRPQVLESPHVLADRGLHVLRAVKCRYCRRE